MEWSTIRWVLVLLPLLVVSVHHAKGTKNEDSNVAKALIFSESPHHVTLGNEKVQVTLGKGGQRGLQGSIRSLAYKPHGGGKSIQLLQRINYGDGKDKLPGYWDMHWYKGLSQSGRNYNSKCSFGPPSRTDLTESKTDEGRNGEMLGVIYPQETMKERHSSPLNAILHYSVRKDIAGVYCSLSVDHTRLDPSFRLTELRLVLLLNPELFDYTYIADDRQRYMHTRRDISQSSSSKLAFKEARLITKPENTSHYGEVDDKYSHSVETKDSTLYGWISTKLGIGVWMISPNKWEYLAGGPTKQELSVQTGPKLLAMLHSQHYGTPPIVLGEGEEWKKTFGPFLIYVNEASSIDDMISDAKSRAAEESRSWSRKWVPIPDYTSHEGRRGLVIGRAVKDQSSNMNGTKIAGMWVGLTDESSPTRKWEEEVKKYQYWNTTNDDGEFTIYNVRPGKYILQTIVHGFLVDSSVLQVVTVKENSVSNMGDVVLRSVQKGPIVWEIGYPDRSAAEFMIPSELNGTLRTFPGTNEFRQYGLWDKFCELYPEKDPVFKIGESDWTKDWFFAHVLCPKNRITQREIEFTIDAGSVTEGDYTLRIAVAGAHQAALEVRVNNQHGLPLFDTGCFGKDNALARAGIHGQYHEFSVSLSHMNLRAGQNSIFLRQRRNESRFNYVMYDYVRLEAPATGNYSRSSTYEEISSTNRIII